MDHVSAEGVDERMINVHIIIIIIIVVVVVVVVVIVLISFANIRD